MPRRRKPTPGLSSVTPHEVPANVLAWTVTEDWVWNGRNVTPGTEVTVKDGGSLVRFRFIRHVRNASGAEWIDVVGDMTGFRSFRPERVRTVHRTVRTRANAA